MVCNDGNIGNMSDESGRYQYNSRQNGKHGAYGDSRKDVKGTFTQTVVALNKIFTGCGGITRTVLKKRVFYKVNRNNDPNK